MPIDSHHHLRRLGWHGPGTALQPGGLQKPLTTLQKKGMKGVGGDRDDAFPFWDHVFTVAAKSIVIKVPKGDSDSDSDSDSGSDSGSGSPPQAESTDTDPPTPANLIIRTSTGIISHRRPHLGTPASGSGVSGSSTPTVVIGGDLETGVGIRGKASLLALAKQEAARKMLYARFFRGPVVSFGDEQDETAKVGKTVQAVQQVVVVAESEVVLQEKVEKVEVGVTVERKKKRKREPEAGAPEPEKKRKKGTKKDESAPLSTSESAAFVPAPAREHTTGAALDEPPTQKKKSKTSREKSEEKDRAERKREKKRRKVAKEARRAARAAAANVTTSAEVDGVTAAAQDVSQLLTDKSTQKEGKRRDKAEKKKRRKEGKTVV
ncbi:hypothetical protein DACRYDRAFT_118539 [Dacryopinax primogenitus]|uniref:G-patch domain-containing protein n=1 Tax=Dacryopinax primogenitus (strain DJM 731) TaxID=1858805 RepID=M5G4T5_DACPD|nr:uncharacterized protein DACRYDRAFT_118539 [Dacryopinax primogenitus]EJT98752.1 hypothetical protein DACRYDRAFT_118539 [Dacryopinax primogenitus]